MIQRCLSDKQIGANAATKDPALFRYFIDTPPLSRKLVLRLALELAYDDFELVELVR